MKVVRINNTNQNKTSQPAFGLNFSPKTEDFIKENKRYLTDATKEIIQDLRGNGDNRTLDASDITVYEGSKRIFGYITEIDHKIAGELFPELSEAFEIFFKRVKAFCDNGHF